MNQSPKTWDTVINKMAKWQAGQFPETTVKGALAHLTREVTKELPENAMDTEEWADAFHMVIQGGTLASGSLDNFLDRVSAKLQKNRFRKWPDQPDKDNVYEHVGPDK
jgi:hypothetical protein